MKPLAFCFTLLAVLAGTPLAGATADNDAPKPQSIIILANANEPQSVALAKYYAGKRSIPEANIVALPMPSADTISWEDYVHFIEGPLHSCFRKNGWLVEDMPGTDAFGRTHGIVLENRIGYLVTCQGVPLSIADEKRFDTPANRSDFLFLIHAKTGTKVSEILFHSCAAVDSELAAMPADVNPVFGFIPNPLYGKKDFGGVARLRIIRTSRLGGADYAAARSLVDSAIQGEKEGLSGRVYIDRGGPFALGDRWLDEAAATYAADGWDVQVERSNAVFQPDARFDAPAFYFGWYSPVAFGPMMEPGMHFPPGSVAAHLYSFSAYNPPDRTGWCSALIDRGVAGTVGNVSEPGLEMTHNFAIMARALVEGRSFCDAAWSAMPVMSWQSVVFGDPLYRPLPCAADGSHARPFGEYGELAGIIAMEERGARAEALAAAGRALESSGSWAISLEYAKLLHEVGRDADAATALNFMANVPRVAPECRALAFGAAKLLGDAGQYQTAFAILDNLRSQEMSDPFRKTVAAYGRELASKSGRAEFIARWPKEEAPAK